MRSPWAVKRWRKATAMKDNHERERAELLRRIGEVIERHTEAAHLYASIKEAAHQWMAAGFDDAEEVDEWLGARCFSAEGALSLEMAGITPDQAAMLTRAGTGEYEETIGYKVIKGDLSIEEARRIITSAFWNS
jgi:hypothetical protein